MDTCRPSPRSASRWRRARPSPSSAPTARASRRCCARSSVCTSRPQGPSRSAAGKLPRCRRTPGFARGSRSSLKGAGCFHRSASKKTSWSDNRRGDPVPGACAPSTSSLTGWGTAVTSRPSTSPVVSSRRWPSGEPWWRTLRSFCSTSFRSGWRAPWCGGSTASFRSWSRAGWRSCSWSRTSRKRCASPTAFSACSRAAPRSRANRQTPRRRRSRPPTLAWLAGPAPGAPRELGQRNRPGDPPRRPLRALRLRAVVALRRRAGCQPRPRRLRGAGRLPRPRRDHDHARARVAHLRHRRAPVCPLRLRRAAADHPEEPRSLAADDLARHLRTLGRHPERVAGGGIRRQPFVRSRQPHLGLAARFARAIHRLRAPLDLRDGGRRSRRPAALSLAHRDGPIDPSVGRRPGVLGDRRRQHPPCVRHRRRDRLRDGRARRPGAGKLVVLRSKRRPVAPDLRFRGGHHRRRRFALGDARRRHHPRRRAGGWRPDRSQRWRARRPSGLPRGAGAPTARPDPRPAGRMNASVRVTRSRRSALWGLIGAALVVVLLATLPYVVYADVTDLLVNAFILLVLTSMWNLLAGYCGLISVGQQAYIGVGAYTVLLLAQNGINPYLAIPFAVVVAGAIAVPVSFLVFRLRAEYFAIGTWGVAAALFLILTRFRPLGGRTGSSP